MTDLVLYTSPYYVGREVRVYVAGYDCGDFTVNSDGTVEVPYGSDPEGAMTAANLKALYDSTFVDNLSGMTLTKLIVTVAATPYTIYIPVQVGFAYTSRGKLLRPIVENDVKTKTGPSLGMLRRVHGYAILFNDAITSTYSVGTDFDNLLPCAFLTDEGAERDMTEVYDGVHVDSCTDSHSYDGQLCWEIDGPTGGDVVSVTSFLVTSEK